MHNVDVEAIAATTEAAGSEPGSATVSVHLGGSWDTNPDHVQFSSDVGYPDGMVTLTADFPGLLGGKGRAPAALAYCFYGAMCCYASTFATQAAMVGMEIQDLSITLDVDVDFRQALGMGDFDPMSTFQFHLEVETESSDDEIERVKQLTDERCPAMWAMNNPVPHHVSVTRIA